MQSLRGIGIGKPCVVPVTVAPPFMAIGRHLSFALLIVFSFILRDDLFCCRLRKHTASQKSLLPPRSGLVNLILPPFGGLALLGWRRAKRDPPGGYHQNEIRGLPHGAVPVELYWHTKQLYQQCRCPHGPAHVAISVSMPALPQIRAVL
jgi:hypothetical protein